MSLDTRPLFDFTVSDPFPTFEILDNVRVNGAGELVRGVFPPILLFIARISNLSSDEKEGVRSAEEVRRLGEALEQEIIDWQPSPAAQLETEDSLEELEAFSTREMWRHVSDYSSISRFELALRINLTPVSDRLFSSICGSDFITLDHSTLPFAPRYNKSSPSAEGHPQAGTFHRMSISATCPRWLAGFPTSWPAPVPSPNTSGRGAGGL